MPAQDVHGRLKRLLFLVPYVAKNPGLQVDDVAKALGCSREALLEELDLLTMVGRPPFQPDDFVDIYVEDDRVYVDLDQRFSAPPRLTAAEGVALAAAAELLRPAAADALTGALEKLEKVLPKGARERYRQMSKQLDLALEAPQGLAALSQAIVEHREVELDYFTSSRNETEKRRVQPHELFSHRGQWYLQAHCLTRIDVRLFRLDRIRELALTDTRFTPAADVRSQAMVPQAGEDVVVRFNASVAPYVAERFGDEVKWLDPSFAEPGADHRSAQPAPTGERLRDVEKHGVLEVRVRGDSEHWLTQWVLSFGGDAWVVSPQPARAAVLKAADAVIAS